MPSRTPREKNGWLNLLPLSSEKEKLKNSDEKSKSDEEVELNKVNDDGKTIGKEYDIQSNFHLGCYQTVRGPSKPAEQHMGIANIFHPSVVDKNKSDDGLTIPLTVPPKNKPPSRFSLENLNRLFKTVIRDWIFLALLGFIMASFSFGMDFAIINLQDGQMRLYDWAKDIHISLSLLIWVGYVVGLIIASALFAHYIAPQAIGSGIPEMKTILRGVILKEYLSIRTLVSKMIGLTLSLGSGLPMGKEGPFVHVASVVASQLSRLVHGSSAGIFENESRSGEMLAAGCAVGVACTFSAPIGGVLFSIEVTSVYFAVRNYWRGFFAATCSATLFRILRMFSVSDAVTVEAHYQTNFPPQNAFMPQELPVFALIGLVCGILGSAFVYIHRRTVLFLRRNAIAKMIFQKYWLIYPIFVAMFISGLTFPQGLGQYMGGQERFSHTMKEFFINCTWTAEPGSIASCPPPPNVNSTPGIGDKFDMHHWKGQDLNLSPFMTLTIFQVVYFFLAILASTLPVPSGIFMPVFVLGAAFGRMVGEGVYQWFPDGFSDEDQFFVRPGIYAVVGAAAFCGAVTHTVSVAVIVFELTGQLCHLLPVMIAVLIANATASYMQPSIYDSIIRIKNLPYLPDIPHTSSLYHQMLIDQFMITPVVFIAKDSTVRDVKKALDTKARIRAFPLVDSRESLALVGSVSRGQLQKFVDAKLGTKARFAEATRRIKQKIDEEEEEKRLKEETQSESVDESVLNRSERRPSRFLVVPVQKNGISMGSSKNEQLNNLSDENARKILTTEEKQALFDRQNAGRTINAVSSASHMDNHHTIGDIFRSITHLSFGRQNLQKKASRNEFDLYGDERSEWEDSVLDEKIESTNFEVDSTPFQLSEYTSLFKAHSLFSLLGLNRAYVTKKGQLIGVVALKELRYAIEYLQSGKVPSLGVNIFTEIPPNASNLATISYTQNGRNESGKENMENPTFLSDNGEDDAHHDYIQPPLEVLRRGALTPNQMGELARLELIRSSNESPHFEVSSPSTSSSSVSIDLTHLDNGHSDTGSTMGLVLTVPTLPSRTQSTGDIELRRPHIQINLPDDDVHVEKF